MTTVFAILFTLVAPTVHADDKAEPPLRQQYMEIRKNFLAGPCEESNDEAALEVLDYLEAHPTDPNTVKTDKKSRHDYKEFAGSKMDFGDGKPNSGGVIEFSYGWKRYQEEVRTKAKTYTPEKMLDLVQRIKGLINDDRRRVIMSYNYSVTPENVDKFKELQASLDSCLFDDECLIPKLSDAQIEFVQSVPLYNRWYGMLKADMAMTLTSSLKDTMRVWVRMMAGQAHIDAVRFLDQMNPNIRETEPGSGVIEIAVDLKAFSGKDQRHIHQQIEKIWKTDDLSIVLDEENSKKSKKDPIRFNFHADEPSGRNTSTGIQIDFYPYTLIRDLAHEFGHVLGFKDHYYTVWKNAECEYWTHGDSGDIMSDYNQGKVTNAEWAAIREAIKANAKPAKN